MGSMTPNDIDMNRLYTTGQSMGCMTSLDRNSKYPDLFAASMFVSGQGDISVLEPLEKRPSSTSRRAATRRPPVGRARSWPCRMRTAAYTYGAWNAQNRAEEQTAAVEALLAEGRPINLVRFEAGSVFKEGQSGMEHGVLRLRL